MISQNPPEPGQLVLVRQRHFVVTDVRTSGLPESILHSNGGHSQHLVSLLSVEDEGLGEELQVIWELEPGAQVYEKFSLPEPTGFDDPRLLDAFLDAVRWGAVSSADIRSLQAPFRSGIDIEDYQLDPVVRAIQMPRVNLLVADDVGLGKTIEAGLVLQELILRHRVRSILVICPASIQIQWREQMRDKFGLEFRIVDSALFKDLRRRRGIHVNPWTHFPRLITSLDFIKRERPLRLFRETLPVEGKTVFPRRYDLLIIDEAHNVSPAGGGYYSVDSQRTRTIRMLAPHFEHKLFLTATPHNGYQESFSALLELLDSQRFARGVRPDPRQLHAVMVRRMKSDLKLRWDGTQRFPKRTLEALEVPYTEKEKRAYQTLAHYSRLRQKAASGNLERLATEFVLKLLKKRLFSSPAAFAATLAKHENSIVHKKTSPEKKYPSEGILKRQIELAEEDYADDDNYEETAAETIELASRFFRELSAEEVNLFSELKEYAKEASTGEDTKVEVLLTWLKKFIKPGGTWNYNRVLIFTEYRATQKWLYGLLASVGMAEKGRLEMLYGGMTSEDRERIKAAFQADPQVSPVRILLATDAASEGIDLQNHCSTLIHYEIPWNPNRLEQRNGRLDRHGQRASEVKVYHFVGTGFENILKQSEVQTGDIESDLEFLYRVVRKVETIREDLGKVGPVIAKQIEEAMLGQRSQLDTDKAEHEAAPIRRMLRFERDLRDRIEKLHEQLQESKRELHLTPENILAVVKIGLELAGQPPLQEAHVPGIWPDPSGQIQACPVFHLPPLSGTWAQCHEGLAQPHTGKIRPIVFDHALVNGQDDVVLAHLNHRLVQRCLRLLRAEIWSQGPAKRLHRVTARLVPNHILDTPVVIAHGRLVVLGGDNQRLHEEIITAGGKLREGRFARLNVGEVKTFLEAALPLDVPETLKERFAELWPSHSGPLVQALEVRKADRLKGLQKFLEERATKEQKDMIAVLQELQRSITEELKEVTGPVQLRLWSDPEQEQWERNRSNLKARLLSIPQEIEQETAAINARYANPNPRLFPMAVTYLVPGKIGREFSH